MNSEKCVLHGLNYDYFCEKCSEPICRQCTVLGPHNTQIHRISQLSVTYQQKIHRIKDRISELVDTFRPKILELIDEENYQIDCILAKKTAIDSENSKIKTKLVNNVMTVYEHNIHELNIIKQELMVHLSAINDNGHQFQTLNSWLQIVKNHDQTISTFKQLADTIQILLARQNILDPLPKQLTDMRITLSEIDSLKQLQQQKIDVLRSIFQMTKQELKKIQSPNIPYLQLLNQLSNNITNNTSNHYVCHFCGKAFSFDVCNQECKANKVMLNITDKGYSGFCQPKPDSVRYGTHRHYFGKPANLYKHFKNPQQSFKVHFNALLMKLKTLVHLNKIKIESQFKSNDKQQTNKCDRIVFEYILIQLCKMSQQQTNIIIEFCSSKQLFDYTFLIEKLETISIAI